MLGLEALQVSCSLARGRGMGPLCRGNSMVCLGNLRNSVWLEQSHSMYVLKMRSEKWTKNN